MGDFGRICRRLAQLGQCSAKFWSLVSVNDPWRRTPSKRHPDNFATVCSTSVILGRVWPACHTFARSRPNLGDFGRVWPRVGPASIPTPLRWVVGFGHLSLAPRLGGDHGTIAVWPPPTRPGSALVSVVFPAELHRQIWAGSQNISIGSNALARSPMAAPVPTLGVAAGDMKSPIWRHSPRDARCRRPSSACVGRWRRGAGTEGAVRGETRGGGRRCVQRCMSTQTWAVSN